MLYVHVGDPKLKVGPPEGHRLLLCTGFQLAACFVCGLYQPAVNLGSIDLIVALQAESFSHFCVATTLSFSSSLHLNDYTLVEGLQVLAGVKTFSAGA